MKIVEAEVIHVRHAMVVPAGPAGVFNNARESLLLKVSCDDGTIGWGETYVLSGNKEILRALAANLVGRDPLAIGRIPGPPVVDDVAVASAVSAIDMVLFDLKGKAFGVPAHVLLGGAIRTHIPVYASGFLYRQGEHPRDAWQREADGLLARGFRAVKVRIGAFPAAEEMALLEDMTSRLPSGVRVMVDAWGAYSIAEALTVGRRLQDMGIVWFEEPASPYADYAGYEVLTSALDIPVAGGEMGRTLSDYKRWFDRRAIDLVQPDIAICGGLWAGAAVVELARLYGIPCVPHTWNGAVMAAATIHLAATIPPWSHADPNAQPVLEYDTSENRLMREFIRNPPELVDGAFEVPSSPGLGVEIDEEALRGFAVI